MKLSTKVIIGAACLTTAGILILALKKKNPTTVTAGSQSNQVLDDFIKNHKQGDGYMDGALKAARNYLRTIGYDGRPTQKSTDVLYLAVQKGMNPADLINQYESGVM